VRRVAQPGAVDAGHLPGRGGEQGYRVGDRPAGILRRRDQADQDGQLPARAVGSERVRDRGPDGGRRTLSAFDRSISSYVRPSNATPTS
jgi:hypothetical protein